MFNIYYYTVLLLNSIIRPHHSLRHRHIVNGLLVMTMYSAKTAVSVKMPFGVVGQVSPMNSVFDGGPDPHMMRGKFKKELGGAI